MVVCDANRDPAESAKGDWVRESEAVIEAPMQGSATYCTGSAGEIEVRKTLDYIVVNESLKGKVKSVDVVDEYFTSPHKALRCAVELQQREKHGSCRFRCLRSCLEWSRPNGREQAEFKCGWRMYC